MSATFIGKVIDNYRIIENLGIGGMGVVFKAIHTKLDKMFALKMIAPGLTMNENFIKRFQTEAKALARLEDPNIVRIYDFRSHNEQWFIVMEYVDGINLLTRIKNEGVFSWTEALTIIKKVLSAIGHAHENNIIHRDIKPNNIMLGTDGSVKITDFGLAKDHTTFSNTMTVASGGTLYYMSPEHLKGFSFTDKRSDIYSIGMTLYEMLTGQVPFTDINSDFELREAIVRKEMPKPTNINPDIPLSLEQLVIKSISKDPDKRFQTTDEMLKEIARIEKIEAAGVKKIPQQNASSGQTRSAVKNGDTENIYFQSIRKIPSVIEKLSVSQRIIILLPVLLIIIIMILNYLKGTSDSDLKTTNIAQQSLMSISSSPPSALIYLNDDSIGMTPLQNYPFTPGEHAVRLVKAGYQSVDSMVFLQSGLNLNLDFKMKTIQETFEISSRGKEAPSATSQTDFKILNTSLTVNSTPSNARFLINDKFQGITPFRLPNLAPGKYRLKIEKEGYDAYQRDIDIESGQHPILDIILNSLSSGLVIMSTPTDANVKLNGVPIEKKTTPLMLSELNSGNYEIEVEKTGYSNITRNVELKTGTIDTLVVELSKLTARLSVQVRPWGSIFIDGSMKKSSTDLKFETELPVKEYNLKVTHPTLGIWEKKISLNYKEPNSYIIDFNKKVTMSILSFDEFGNPITAEIFVDEKSTNLLSPADLPVRVGIHKISVKKSGYLVENKDRTFLVENGPMEPLTFILRKTP